MFNTSLFPLKDMLITLIEDCLNMVVVEGIINYPTFFAELDQLCLFQNPQLMGYG
jgi:hypothetical protein